MKAFQIESFDKSSNGIRLHLNEKKSKLNLLWGEYKENVASHCSYKIAFPAGKVVLQIESMDTILYL